MLSIETMPPEGSLGDAAPVPAGVRLPVDILHGHRYVSLIHPEDSRSVAVMTYTDQVWIDGKKEPRTRSAGAIGSEIEETVRNLRPKYVTMQAFRTPRPRKDGKPVRDYRTAPCKALWNLAALQCVTVDLDFYKKGCAYRNQTPETMVDLVLERLRDRNLPYPSYIMCSGKGLLVCWLHDRRTPSYLPVWQAMQKRVNDAFVDMGRDLLAMPPTANFRVAGTKNSGLDVRMLWPEFVDQIARWDFETLRHEILLYTPAQVREYRKVKEAEQVVKAEKARARRANGVAAPNRVKLTYATYCKAVVRDLYNLFEARFEGHPVEKGERDQWLFILSTAAAWVMEPDALKEEIKRLSPLCGLSVKRALTMMGSVISKARRAARGETASYKKRSVDPRYRTNPAMLVDLLGVTVEEAKALDLRVLVPEALKIAREATRSAARRRDAGAKDRSGVQAERLAFGVTALERKAAGTKVDVIAFEANRSISYVEKAMREARAVAAIGKTKAVAKPGRPRKAKIPATIDPVEPKGFSEAETRVARFDAEPKAVVAPRARAYDDAVRSVHLTSQDTTPALALVEAGVDVSDDEDDDGPRFVKGLWFDWTGTCWAAMSAFMIWCARLEDGTPAEIQARYPAIPLMPAR
ncbi:MULTISPECIES: hypothetical protein [unclassified Methylobacterium]|uniref:hypothetical protein n=1 Tax=unclassified Methylobacterium TaxID=2615210 RepID=UPI0011C1E287|nr:MULTISPECIES: hypothetical protein [unclassified Methylobacterium]QEE39836.1 hypothetical protein FVA80_13610 [Methylobacterium sp. WL1]TXN57320.1 hypothetical protein FV241_11700 [Methylobacterium sp. WL2]